MIEIAVRRSRFCVERIPILLHLLVFVFAVSNGISSETARELRSVKKLYVGSLGTEKEAAAIRQRMVDRLRASGKLRIVENLTEADGAITGTCRIWITGHISPSVRAFKSNRSPVYSGFLSTELIGKSGMPLCSYLVTPSKVPFKGIINDLADRLAGKLLKALEEEAPAEPAIRLTEGDASVSVRGAGATFPWPLYQKWFETYEQQVPHFHVRYDPIGSESGIRLLTQGAVEFAGSDMPLSDRIGRGRGANLFTSQRLWARSSPSTTWTIPVDT
ncbi:MAG TPA: substrate-binding domain-containing protein [Blastocatellia bacterium]|nr:substrate-binding domain-containing protein [Blastocatellia bacterium]